MSDWNEQAAPNNNLNPATILNSKLVGKEGLNAETSKVSMELPTVSKDGDELDTHLKSRQPGM
jgi:hypothetical protein